MKKVIAVLMCVLLLTGCKNESLGIIGGADGPTAIFVTDGESQITGESVRLMKVDGSLYYDTGKTSSLIPRCGTLDGNLSCSIGEFEVPKGDNEANFETSGYQNVTSITKEVPLEGNWRIFKSFPKTKADLGKYQYAIKLKGRHPNAVRDSEYIVLTNDVTMDFASVSRSMFSSNSEDWLDCYVLPVHLDEGWGVSMWAEDVTATGLTLICEQFGGNADGQLQTGEWYTLEAMNEENEWVDVPTNPLIDYAWNSVAYNIKANEQSAFEIDWQWLYGKLPAGQYRIGKEIMNYRAPGDFDKEIYYADFYVE